ncbi:MAG TPA: aldo/keto reductase [Actinomycetota bacterium]|nr:aldo/keto reductase [Actinomycetota bacterium]
MGTPAAAAGTVRVGDRTVNRMGFGAMRITGDGIWGPPADPEGARALLRRVVELGVNLIDTADAYGPGTSEELIAEALHPYPGDLVIATKGGLLRSGPGRWDPDCRPDHLKRSCEESLRRLRVDRITLYQLHTGTDPDVAFADSVGALAELRAEGKIEHVGLSNVTLEQVREAESIVPIVSVQNRYGLWERDGEDVIEHCEREGLAFLPWYPLAAGAIVRPGDDLDGVAAEHGASRVQVALAWLLQRSPSMLPIPGTSRVEHLEENVGAAAIRLTDHQMQRLEEM